MMDFYDFLDSLLKERGWSRVELARRAGINYNSMSTAYKRKADAYTIRNVFAIAKALEVPARLFSTYIKSMPDFHTTCTEKQELYLNNFDEGFARLKGAYLRLNDKGMTTVADIACALVCDPKYSIDSYEE